MRFNQEAQQIVARHCKVAGLIRHCSSSKSGKVSVTSLMLRHPRRKYWDRSFVPSFCCMSPQVCSFSLTPQQPPSQIYFPLSHSWTIININLKSKNPQLTRRSASLHKAGALLKPLAATRDRTGDLLIFSQMLSQLSYHGYLFHWRSLKILFFL